jgi:hypothetical protein
MRPPSGGGSGQDVLEWRWRKAIAVKMRAKVTDTEAPSIMLVQSGVGWRASTQANIPCVGRKLRRNASAVMLSRMLERIANPTAPPTAPSGASVKAESHEASPAMESWQMIR